MGGGDDYFLYRGVIDPRFVLIPHDLDSVLDRGGSVNASIFSIVRGGTQYDGVDGLKRFFNQPDIVIRYCQTVQDLMDEFFNPETLDPLFERVLGGFASASRIAAMKQRVRQRIAAVVAEIDAMPIATRASRLPDTPAPPEPAPVEVPPRPLVINEVLVANVSALRHDNAFPGMVELYCAGPAAMSLAGLSLTDDPALPRKFIFPPAATIAPGHPRPRAPGNSLWHCRGRARYWSGFHQADNRAGQ